MVAAARKLRRPTCVRASFTADPDGFGQVAQEVTGDQAKNYTYRADGRLIGYQKGNLAVSYHYDGLNRLVAKSVNQNGSSYTQAFLHLGKENRVLLSKAGDGSITTHIDGRSRANRLGEVKNGVGKGYITDHLGSVLNSGPAGSNKVLGIFGEPSADVELSLASPAVVYGFTGLPLMAESGTYFTSPRTYDPRTGRWNRQEPTGLDGPNLYWYAGNNPLRYVDTTGLRYEIPSGFEGYKPEAPPGVDIGKNIEEAKNMSPLEFQEAVKSGGKWDYKRLGKQYEDFGNYNFGVTGRACGFGPETLKRGAGAYQIYSGTSDPSFGSPWDLGSGSSYGDDPTDQANIGGGIWDYDNNNAK